jgi:hypothetical protein
MPRPDLRNAAVRRLQSGVATSTRDILGIDCYSTNENFFNHWR